MRDRQSLLWQGAGDPGTGQFLRNSVNPIIGGSSITGAAGSLITVVKTADQILVNPVDVWDTELIITIPGAGMYMVWRYIIVDSLISIPISYVKTGTETYVGGVYDNLGAYPPSPYLACMGAYFGFSTPGSLIPDYVFTGTATIKAGSFVTYQRIR